MISPTPTEIDAIEWSIRNSIPPILKVFHYVDKFNMVVRIVKYRHF